MRMVIDLADLSRSVAVHSTGQSGHPFADAYDDLIEPWRAVEAHPMLWTREDVEASAVDCLRLRPADG